MRKPKPTPNMTLEQSRNYYAAVSKYLYHRWAMLRQRGEGDPDFRSFMKSRINKF